MQTIRVGVVENGDCYRNVKQRCCQPHDGRYSDDKQLMDVFLRVAVEIKIFIISFNVNWTVENDEQLIDFVKNDEAFYNIKSI